MEAFPSNSVESDDYVESGDSVKYGDSVECGDSCEFGDSGNFFIFWYLKVTNMKEIQQGNLEFGGWGSRQDESKFGAKRSLDSLLPFCKLSPALLLYCFPGSTLEIQIFAFQTSFTTGKLDLQPTHFLGLLGCVETKWQIQENMGGPEQISKKAFRYCL